MGTGSTGGTYFALGGAMANAINDKLADKKITITAQSTGASVENMNLINAGEMDLGIAMNNVAANAFDGVGAFSSPVTNVSSIGVVYNEVYQIVANAATGAKNVEEPQRARRLPSVPPAQARSACPRRSLPLLVWTPTKTFSPRATASVMPRPRCRMVTLMQRATCLPFLPPPSSK